MSTGFPDDDINDDSALAVAPLPAPLQPNVGEIAGMEELPAPPSIDISPAGESLPPRDLGEVIPIITAVTIDAAAGTMTTHTRRLRCHSDGRVFLLPFDPNPPAEDCPGGVKAERPAGGNPGGPEGPAGPVGPPQRPMGKDELNKALREYLRKQDRERKAKKVARHKKNKGMR